MTAESLKHFISLPPGSTYKKVAAKGRTFWLILFSIFLFIFCVLLLGIVIWNASRIKTLQQDMDKLRVLVDNLEKQVTYSELEDLPEFEKEYERGQTESPLDYFGFDEDDFDDELDFDSEEDLAGSGVYDLDEDEDDDEDDDIEGETQGHIFYEVGKRRKPRSISYSHGSIPVYEESYAYHRQRSDPDDPLNKFLLQKSKNAAPTLRYDWSDKKRTDKIRSNLPQTETGKFMESRAQPESVRTIRPHPVEHFKPYRPHNQDRSSNNGGTVYYRSSISMFTDDDTNKPKQMFFNGTRPHYRSSHLNYPKRNYRPRTIRRRAHNHSARLRSSSVAVHYVGDSSRYTTRHEHYKGNGRLRHAGGVYVDWIADQWVQNLDMNRYFELHDGIVTVKSPGIYYVYAQLFYHDDHDLNGFVVDRNGQQFLQCTTMTPSDGRVTKSNSCFTSGVTYLDSGDNIRIADLASERYILFQGMKSFFGLVKLGEAQIYSETA